MKEKKAAKTMYNDKYSCQKQRILGFLAVFLGRMVLKNVGKKVLEKVLEKSVWKKSWKKV